jgi:hypothetical protein
LYTAGSIAGRFAVIATCACGLVDTAVVDVAQLTALAISPKTVSVAAGAIQPFSATANWSTGATTLPPLTWTADAGSITSAGLYTAPTTAGTYRVFVAHTGGTRRDTAIVTVTGGSVTTPPANSAACPNEPSTNQLYREAVLSTPTAPAGFSFWGGTPSVTTDNLAPASSTVLTWRKPAGTGDGQIGGLSALEFAVKPRTVYGCIFFKKSANYVEHPAGTKFLYPFVQTATNYKHPFQMAMLPVDSTKSGKFRWMVEMFSGDKIAALRGSNVNDVIMQNDRWYRLEVLVVSGTPGTQTSVIRWWTSEWNGSSWSAPVLSGNHTNALFAVDGTGAFASWDHNFYYGGQGAPATTADQFLYMSNIRISTGN